MAHTVMKFQHVLGYNVQGDLGGLTTYTNKNRRVVWFPQMPPLKPPTEEQNQQRDAIRNAAADWRALTVGERTNWRDAANKARLRITGYNFFTYWKLKNDDGAVHTVERITGITLI